MHSLDEERRIFLKEDKDNICSAHFEGGRKLNRRSWSLTLVLTVHISLEQYSVSAQSQAWAITLTRVCTFSCVYFRTFSCTLARDRKFFLFSCSYSRLFL